MTRKGSPEAEGLFTLPGKGPKPPPPRPEPVAAAEATPVPSPAVQVPTPPPPPVPVPEWITQARQVDLLTVARHVGVDVVADDAGGHRITPCPRCGSSDGATVLLNPRWNVRQWRCPACKGRGGNLDLAALTLMGAPLGRLDDDGREAVRGWFEEMGWCSALAAPGHQPA